MQELIQFTFESNSVRALNIDGKSWFVAADVCEALTLPDTHKVVSRLDEDEKGRHTIPTLGGSQVMTIIDESGLYSLILTSRKPEAKRFKKWITGEVLPSIRKHGGYIAGQESTDDPALILARALQVAQSVIQQNEIKLTAATQQLEHAKPKVDFYDQVTGSKDAIDIGRAAKVLNMGIGRNKLFEFLRAEKILQPNNQPYQKHIDAGHFRVIEQKFTKPNGETSINFKTVVYQRGLDYIRKRIDQAREQRGVI